MLSAWTGTVITADTRVWTRPLTERTVCVSAELMGVCFCEPCPFALPLLPTPHAHPRPQLWGHGKEQSGSDRPSGMRMLEEDFNSLHAVQIIPSGRSKSQALARMAQQTPGLAESDNGRRNCSFLPRLLPASSPCIVPEISSNLNTTVLNESF